MFILLFLFQLLNDVDGFIQVYGNWELTLCCGAMALFLLRFYSLGTKITKKYRCLSTLITEQMNLYLHMEQKPHKKDELLVANSVSNLQQHGFTRSCYKTLMFIAFTVFIGAKVGRRFD